MTTSDGPAADPEVLVALHRAPAAGPGRGGSFDGLPAYEPGPGVHPIALLDEYEPGTWSGTGYELPSGWGPGALFPDAADLEVVELVGCLRVVEERPTGQDCEFEADGDVFTLELVDLTYDLEVIAAASGEPVQTLPLEASHDGQCPLVATIEEGDTESPALLDDEDLTAALRPIVEG